MLFYADDDIDDLEFFGDAAREFGRVVLTFNSGDDLLRQLKNPPPIPGVIFLDMNMPKKNGLEVLNEIRANKEWKQYPVVMFSTSSDNALIEECYACGANLFITKPANYRALTNVLEHTLTKVDFSKMEKRRENFHLQT